MNEARALRRIHIAFAAVLLIATITLTATTSLGTVLFQPRVHHDSPLKNLQTSSLIPLLLTDVSFQPSGVFVKGKTQVTRQGSVAGFPTTTAQPSGVESTHFINSFSFSLSAEKGKYSVYASWNTDADGTYLYVIHQAMGNDYHGDNPAVYSIEGDGLAVSSPSFSVDSVKDGLYLSVYKVTAAGSYDFVEDSAIVFAH
jgi:hypothetical protein